MMRNLGGAVGIAVSAAILNDKPTCISSTSPGT
jgi:hypothetical protein